MTNPAAVLYGVNDLRYEHHALAKSIAPGHVRIQMRAVGICGSDVHYYKKVNFSHLIWRGLGRGDQVSCMFESRNENEAYLEDKWDSGHQESLILLHQQDAT